MKTQSVWEETKTFFPIFIDRLEKNCNIPGKVCVVGASDGKFVLPLVKRGWYVTAIEINEVVLYGGLIEFPGQERLEIPGLISRLREENLENSVRIIHGNFSDCEMNEPHEAVFTSCSWHYSLNHNVPLKDYIQKMQAIVNCGGIFCAEYMMPCEEKHNKIEHYVREEQLKSYFDQRVWEIWENFYTDVFEEKAHVGNIINHKHRMGFLMAKKVRNTHE